MSLNFGSLTQTTVVMLPLHGKIKKSSYCILNLKAMRWIFWGFCRNWFLMSPLHYLSGCLDFGFEFAEIFVLKNDSPLSRTRRVADSLYRWYGESLTPRIIESGSRRLPSSLICGVGNSPHHRYGELAIEFFLKKTLWIDDTESRWLPAPVIRWVSDSPYRWVGKSPTPRITNTESRRLRVLLSRGVDDSAYRWYGKSLF